MRIWSLLAGFLLLCASVFAQEGYIDTPVSTTQVTATNIISGRVSATTFLGDGSGLLILPPSATVPMRAADLWSSPIDVRAYGAICDGTIHSVNLTAAHLAASLAIGNLFKTVIDLPDNCVWGTNTTNGLETPLVWQDNTTVRVFGRHKMATNNSTTQGLFVTKAGYSDGDTVSATNIDIIGMAGNSIDTISRTDLGVSWKMFVLGNCNNCSVRGINISTTTFLGSFAFQARNPTNVTFEDNTYALIPSPDGRAGGDGIHGTGNINGLSILHNNGKSVDDCISLTDENVTMAGKTITGVRILGNKCATYAFSGLKLFTGNSATNSLIDDVIVDNNQFSVWGPKGVDGNCIKIDQEVGQIRNIRFGINTCDDTNGNGVAVLLTADTPGGVDNVDLGRLEVKNYPSRALEIDGNVTNTKSSGAILGPWLGNPSVIVSSTGVSAILRSGSNAAVVYLTSSTNLASVSTAGTNYIVVTGMNIPYNNWTALITGRDVTNSTVTISSVGVSTSTNETDASGTASIIDRGTGVAVYDRGSFNTHFNDLTIIDPPTHGYLWTTLNGNTYASTTVPSISYYATDTAKITISTTTGPLSEESPYSGYVSAVSFTNSINNFTNAKIVSVSTAGRYMLVNIPGYTSATNESNTSATITSIYLPTNGSVINSRIVSHTAGTGFSIQAGQGIALRNNRCIDSQANVCAADSSSVNVSGTIAIGNADEGTSRRYHQSWNFNDAQYDQIYLNVGTNSDWFSKVRDLGLISASTVQAVSATVASTLNVSGTVTFGGLLNAANASLTAVSATGNISANKFVGDGSLLTGITALASAGGSPSQVGYNNNGALAGAAGINYNSTTLETSFTGNVITNNVSGTRVMGTNSGSCSQNTLQVQSQNNGFYRPASGQVGQCANGTEYLRGTASSVSTSLQFIAAGGISTSLAGATSRSLCVSPNGAVYASPTCP